jgi:hypothetical protein
LSSEHILSSSAVEFFDMGTALLFLPDLGSPYRIANRRVADTLWLTV